MDKTRETHLSEYSEHNQILVIENHFTDSASIRRVIQEYILEQGKHPGNAENEKLDRPPWKAAAFQKGEGK